MTSKIDESQWLPPRDTVITTARKRNKSARRIAGEKGGIEFRSVAIPLEFYLARGHITEKQYRAGCRVHSLWRGSLLVARYSRMRFGDVASDMDPESMALIPRDYFRAMEAVSGFLERSTVRRVCCFDEVAGSGRAMDLLRHGLDDLVRHFRY